MQVKNNVFILLVSLLLVACDDPEEKPNSHSIIPIQESNSIKISSPSDGFEISNEKKLDYEIEILAKDLVDSVKVFINDKPLFQLSGSFQIDSLPLGENDLRAKAYLKNGKIEVRSASFVKLSDIIPKEYTYKIVNIFDHNADDYTQGLEFSDGILYESTGQYGESGIKVWDPTTGEEVNDIALDNAFFGEGLTIIDDKIYQLTWRENTGFIYDKKSLNTLQTFSYTMEGWGLTHDNKHLIISDGSNELTFLDKQKFNVIKVIQVFDDVSGVYDLNELEYIDGDIYANVYRTNMIVIIDPTTGKVKGRINLQGLLNNVKVEEEVDVLNGIAYNRLTKKLYVTGKWWPAIFEIKVLPINNI